MDLHNCQWANQIDKVYQELDQKTRADTSAEKVAF